MGGRPARHGARAAIGMHSYRWSDLVLRMPHAELAHWGARFRRLTPLRARAAHLWDDLPVPRRYWAGSAGTGVVALCLLKLGLGGPASGALRLHVEAAPPPPVAAGFLAERDVRGAQTRFVSRGDSFVLALGAHDPRLSLGLGTQEERVLRFHLVGGRMDTPPVAENPLPQDVSLRPASAGSPRSLFGSILHDDVYSGIGLRFLGHRGAVELRFVVDRGGSPEQIELELEGADRVERTDAGGLLATAGAYRLRYEPPSADQPQGRTARPVEVAYDVTGPRRVRFRVGTYDIRLPLVIRCGRGVVSGGGVPNLVAAR